MRARFCCILAAGVVCAQMARANVLFYDSFNYAASPNPATWNIDNSLGQNVPWDPQTQGQAGSPIPNWALYYRGNSGPYVPTGSLSYSNLSVDPSPNSNSAMYRGSGGSGDNYHFFGQPATWDGSSTPPFTSYPVNPATPTTLYYSLVMRVNQIGTTDGWAVGGANFPDGQFLTAFMNTTSVESQTAQGNVAGALMIASGDGTSASTTYKLGIGNTVNASTQFSSATYGLNDTLFVVVAYTMTSSTNTAKLYIDPIPGSLESSNSVAAQITGEPSTSLTGFVLKDDQHLPDHGLQIDELRIGDTWADVTPAADAPEPAALSMLCAPMLLALSKRRRRA